MPNAPMASAGQAKVGFNQVFVAGHQRVHGMEIQQRSSSLQFVAR